MKDEAGRLTGSVGSGEVLGLLSLVNLVVLRS